MFSFYILWNHHAKDCSVRLLKDKLGIKIIKDFPNFNFTGKIILDPEAEPLSAKDANREFVIIDMPWHRASGFFKRIPETVERRSIVGFKPAYPMTSPITKRPESGLRSIECIFAVKLVTTGTADENILDKYYFKDKFLEINKEVIERYNKKL